MIYLNANISTNLLYRQHRMNNMNLESLLNKIKQLVYQEYINSEEPNNSSENTEVVGGSRLTKETVLIFHKPNIKSPVDFDLLYGKDNKTYIEVSKNFNCRAYKWKSFKVETSRLKELVADILKEKKGTIKRLRIVLAFDYASCDCFYPAQVYRDLWSHFKEFPHYVDIIKHSRELNEITKCKEQKISVLDACTSVEVNREQDPQISFNTPVFKMNNSIDPFIRSTVLFEASNTDAEAMAERNEITSITSTLEGVNVVIPELVDKVKQPDENTDLDAIVEQMNKDFVEYSTLSTLGRRWRFQTLHWFDMQDCFRERNFKKFMYLFEFKPDWFYPEMTLEVISSGHLLGEKDIPNALHDTINFFWTFCHSDGELIDRSCVKEQKKLIRALVAIQKILNSVARGHPYFRFSIFNNSKDAFRNMKGQSCDREDCSACRGSADRINSNYYTNQGVNFCIAPEREELKNAYNGHVSVLRKLNNLEDHEHHIM